MTCIYIALIIYTVKFQPNNKDEWNEMQKFSSKLDKASQNNLVKLPFPILIVGESGSIFWYNEKFHSVFKDKKIIGSNINELAKNISIKDILSGKKNQFNMISIKDKFYDIIANVINADTNINDDENIILLYFVDVTKEHSLVNEVYELETCIMLIEVDNLDEILKTTEEDKKPLFVAEIERKIKSYAQSLNAMIEKISQSEYVLSVKRKYILLEIEKKFDVLDDIRDINIGNKLSATLSIGVGINGETPLKNHEYAIAAKDLALGRGGDQAIIKDNDKLEFYGGKTKEFEKRTKVRARVIAHALIQLIEESKNIIIMGHTNPDVDCLGAAIGINSIANMLNKKCNIVLNNISDSIKVIYNMFKNDKDYNGLFIGSDIAKRLIEDNTLLILVDVHGINYVDDYDIVERCSRIVIIDHHRKGPKYINKNILSYIEAYASSTSELITEMIPYMVDKPKLKVKEAEALLAGICVDTKNFYFKTGVRTFEAAAFLRRLGADTIDIKKVFANNLSEYLKKANIVESAKINDKIAISVCPQDVKDPVLAAQAADELLNIINVEASFVLIKINNDVLISGRSLGNINVQVILEKLGGGGHITMAGAKILNSDIDNACIVLEDKIKEYLKEM